MNSYKEYAFIASMGAVAVLSAAFSEYGPADAFKALGSKTPEASATLNPLPEVMVTDIQAASRSLLEVPHTR